ncbi:MAG: hypothetical protein VKJ24_21325 [Synechococcales bacterium]|nr:hypothetical protein [Synechococcales bacterium]
MTTNITMTHVDPLQLQALLSSIALEGIVVFGWGSWAKFDRRSLVWVACGTTCITHPFLWQMWLQLAPTSYIAPQAFALEIMVAGVESLGYRWAAGCSWGQSLGLSFMANLASYLVSVFYPR